VIWDKAQDLGRMIGQSAEYQALRRSEASLREDKETVAMLDQIQTLARQVDHMVSSGQMPDQVTAESYETAVRDLEMSPVGQAYVVARSNFEKLMAKVNQQINRGGKAPPAASSRWMRPRALRRPEARRIGVDARGPLAERVGRARRAGGGAGAGGTRPARLPGRRCSIRSTWSAPSPSCSLSGRAAELVGTASRQRSPRPGGPA
jgi:cell fate (sporulation/competence/biofilm development) regulator YlbF (YheA/YmcA/DUF963 family)